MYLRVSSRVYYPEVKFGEEAQLSTEELDRRHQEEEINQHKRQMSNSLAMIIVGVPVYAYHWRAIKKEKE